MNRIKYETLKELVKRTAAEIQPLLPPLPGHEERCAPAHIWGALKYCYNEHEIKKLPDIEYDNCMQIVKFVGLHPEDTRDYNSMIPVEMHRNHLYNQKQPSLDELFGE